MIDFNVSALWCTPMRRGVVHSEFTEPLPCLSPLEWCEIKRMRLSSGSFLSLSTQNHQHTRANLYGQDGNGPAENPFPTSDMYCVRHRRASSGSNRLFSWRTDLSVRPQYGSTPSRTALDAMAFTSANGKVVDILSNASGFQVDIAALGGTTPGATINGPASGIVSSATSIGGDGIGELREIKNGMAGTLALPRHSSSAIA